MLKFSDVVYRIYEATLSPEHWPAALDGIATLSGSEGALVYAKRPTGWDIAAHSPGLADAVRIYADEHWWQHNPWLDQSVEVGFRVGDVYCDHDIIGDKRATDLPFYSQFLPRVGLGWQMAAVIQADLGVPTGLVVQRAKPKGPYATAEMDTLQLVSRHLEQSLRISSKFAAASAAEGSAAAALDTMDHAAFVLDGQQRPVIVNQPAQHLMGRYFTHDEGRLVPARRHEQEAFSAVVRNAHAADPQASGAPQPTTISDPQGGGPLVVWTLPVVGASANHLGITQPDAHVLVLAQPLEQDRVIDPGVLRNVFELTLGEARLAALLGAGQSLKDAASQLGITEGTARVVLKRVFQKLDVGRQAELVSKLAMFAKPAP
ncbi:helix-turn-helix transcriptional regulator [Xanthobacter sp. V4C-4]|uniref:helix-turn-helix transcriptional regulator n=1 Tax=Xanthobacter cornucopiae TaxID=3119924 RepID=UPI0037273563